MEIYIVNYGDTVDNIAEKFGIDTNILIYINQINYPFRLAIGQALLIPTGNEMSNKRTIRVNGYAYPFINSWTLDQTLPYLTDMSVFSYGFTFTGELIPPKLPVEWMISNAYENSTRPILTLTPFGEDGKFNNRLINSIVRNPEYSSKLISDILETVREKGYLGVDVDFEYILAEDRDYFTEFVRNITKTMNDNGITVSVALAPKVSADQEGLLYQGKDYKSLGEAANWVLLMTYEWGYKYGPPLPVAPINLVRNVVEYAVTEISPDKINLGIPNYGYDWPLPYERNVTEARTIGNIEAIQIAIQNNAEIKYDDLAQSPFFEYIADGIEHIVWFEDVRSLTAKFELINEFELMGAGYWTVMQWFRPNWELLSYYFNILGKL